MKQTLIGWAKSPPGGWLFVVVAALVVGLAGYVFPELFPDVAANSSSDRYTIWFEILIFGGSAVLLLVRTRRWTWLGRAIVWVFAGLVCLYLLLGYRFERWEFTRTPNWLWMTRFVINFGAITYFLSLVGKEIRDRREARREGSS